MCSSRSRPIRNERNSTSRILVGLLRILYDMRLNKIRINSIAPHPGRHGLANSAAVTALRLMLAQDQLRLRIESAFKEQPFCAVPDNEGQTVRRCISGWMWVTPLVPSKQAQPGYIGSPGAPGHGMPSGVSAQKPKPAAVAMAIILSVILLGVGIAIAIVAGAD